jgi:hypothetical protein
VEDQFLVHFAFTASGSTDWFERVSDAEYAEEAG